MVARTLCLANAFQCKCISQQGREREASAAPAGCLEIGVLCLRLSFGAGCEEAGGTAGLGAATGDVPSSAVLCGVLRRSCAARAPGPW